MPVPNSLSDLYAAACFARGGLVRPDYHFPDSLLSAVALSIPGEQIRDELRTKFEDVSDADLTMALFSAFGADNDLLVDLHNSSVEEIFEILSKEVADRRLNYPLVFGRILHDQFIDNFGAIPIDALTPEQTQRLMALTPQGVFQIGQWVSGPFGLLSSLGRRLLQPQTCGPAIRCMRVVCNELHHIKMKTGVADSTEVYRHVRAFHPKSVDIAEKLEDVLVTYDEFYRVNHPGGLPWLLGNGFTEAELSLLAERVLDENTDGLRKRVNDLLGGSAAKRPAAHIVRSLGHADLLQMLLVLDDVSLVKSIEAAIEEKLIVLSPTEVRRSFENQHINGGYFKVDVEASTLGVRFVPKRHDLTEPRMLAVIRAVFSGKYESALSWQLRNEPGGSSFEKLEKCLEDQDPRDLLHRLLFSSQEALERAFSVLEYGRFSLPAADNVEEQLIEKMLWKLGSPLPTPKPPYASLDRHISRLSRATAAGYPDEDARIIAIRDAGMSMFVELEELLRSASQFACWALLNDHYGMHPFERFRYSKNRAVALSNQIYGEEAAERGSSFPYDPTAGNTLSVLISAFRVLAEVCDQRAGSAERYIRPAWQIPTFSNHSDVQKFPLQHTSLFFDLHAAWRERLLDSLRSATLSLTRTDICEVRNSLGHPRETFPKNERLTNVVKAIQDAVACLTSVGLMPIIRKYSGETIDRFNRRRIRMADGYGDEIILTAPNQLMMLNMPSYSVPQIAVQGAYLEGSLQPARFEVADDSEWTEAWHDVGLIDSWLNRGEIVPITEELAVEASSSEQGASGASARLY